MSSYHRKPEIHVCCIRFVEIERRCPPGETMSARMLFLLSSCRLTWKKNRLKAYKWVDWETRLCDWETQKQVCLYAERLPSFLLLRWKINARKFKPIIVVAVYGRRVITLMVSEATEALGGVPKSVAFKVRLYTCPRLNLAKDETLMTLRLPPP